MYYNWYGTRILDQDRDSKACEGYNYASSTAANTTLVSNSTSSLPTYRGMSVDCTAFKSQAEAQNYYNWYKAPLLDQNRDSKACEAYPYRK